MSWSTAIEQERTRLSGLEGRGRRRVDTSDLNVHQLRDRIIELFGDDGAGQRMQTTGHVVRLQARAAARRRPGVRLPLPAEPALGRGPASAHRSRSEVRDYVLAQPVHRRVPRPARRPARPPPAGVRGRRASRTCRSRSAAPAAGTGRWRSSRRSWRGCAPMGTSPAWPIETSTSRDRPSPPTPAVRRSSPSAAATAWRRRLRAARAYAGELTAVVSVADDGGSSGRLPRDPAGDACAGGPATMPGRAGRPTARCSGDALEHRFVRGTSTATRSATS